MMLCCCSCSCSLREQILPFLRDYDRLQSFAVILIYFQIGCTLIGSLGALYNGVLLINLGIALFALVAIECRNQKLLRTYAVLLFCALPLDISWFILFTHDIWNISSEDYGMFVIFSLKLTLAMQIIGFTVRFSSSLLWIQIYRLGVSYVDTTGSGEADYDLRNSFLSPATPAVVRQPSDSDYILGGTIYDPAYFSSLFEGQENRCSHGAPKTSVHLSTPISESPKTELQPPMAKSCLKTDKDASKRVSSLQSEPPKGELVSKLEPSVTTDPTTEISTSLTSGSQPSFSNMANPAPNVTLHTQPAQPSTARVLFPTPLPTSGSTTGEKNESLDVAETEKDEMEEEAPETSNTAELSLGSLGAFGIGSTPTATAPNSNPFGGPFGNAASIPMSSAFDITVPSGQLFRPASFSFQSPQSSQPSQPTNSSAFSGGFSTGTTAQAPTQTGFGQPAQIGSGQQALGSVLGSFGQSRQIGTGLPGTGFGSPSGFGGGGFTGTSSPGGFSSAATGGGFAGISSTGGGFASVALGVAGFASVASAGGSGGFSGGGFAGASSAGGGFAGAPSAGGGFGAFNNQQGSGFSAFSGSTGGTGKPTELFTQIRK
ncbi:hypothetical protein CMV_030486 [Castanea mollissima]|uniref:Uncharacterized protein n=1 Tax=Castanea mollissima TaxID=60419 RepID=A0A8J4Q577_9ROSI|nr:hypothetical protein CMV_030486 [Castanea mollissima]